MTYPEFTELQGTGGAPPSGPAQIRLVVGTPRFLLVPKEFEEAWKGRVLSRGPQESSHPEASARGGMLAASGGWSGTGGSVGMTEQHVEEPSRQGSVS